MWPWWQRRRIACEFYFYQSLNGFGKKGEKSQVLFPHLVSPALVSHSEISDDRPRVGEPFQGPPGSERDCLGRTVIALPPSFIFWKPIGTPSLPPPRHAHVYLHPRNVSDSSAAAGEQQAKCRVCSCAIVRGEIWNSSTRQIEVLYVHPLRWDD